MDILQFAEQFRKVVQKFAASLDDENALEVASIYEPWQVGKAYKINEIIVFGINEVGDPQLYRVVQTHTSQDGWFPITTPSLYVTIGLDDDGHPVWSQPTGAHDAYNTGDVVNYNGELYESLIDGNIWSPYDYPAGWKKL